MRIWVHIDGANKGPFSIEEVKQMVVSGQLAPDQKVFIDEQKKWMPLSQVHGLKNISPSISQQVTNNLIEYRRTCQVCGKVWHSLVSREKQILSSQTTDFLMGCGSAMQSCGSCGTIGTGTQVQASRNLDANQSELQRLRSCPQCSSANYREEVINYANQLR